MTDLKAQLKKEKMELEAQKRKIGTYLEDSEYGFVRYFGASTEMKCQNQDAENSWCSQDLQKTHYKRVLYRKRDVKIDPTGLFLTKK